MPLTTQGITIPQENSDERQIFSGDGDFCQAPTDPYFVDKVTALMNGTPKAL
jgi:hypothetical protein